MDKNSIALILIGVLVLFVAYQFFQLSALSKQAANTGASVASVSAQSDYEKMMEEHHGGKASAAAANSLPGQVGGC